VRRLAIGAADAAVLVVWAAAGFRVWVTRRIPL
jgi:hypothetical protein